MGGRFVAVVFAWGWVAGAGACGSTVALNGAGDAGSDGVGESGDLRLDGAADVATSDGAPQGDASRGRCPGASYAASPDGAACDPTHIVRAGSLEAPCYGPALGAMCDRVFVTLPAAEAASLPAGFACGSPELGMVTCVWDFGDDASVHSFDSAALEAACAATSARPAVEVVCQTHGS